MPEENSGLLTSVKLLASTLTSIVSTRLELFANELEEERLRLTQMLLFYMAALFCLGMCLLLFTAFVVVMYWDDHRLAVLGGFCILYLMLSVLMVMLLRKKAQAGSKLFSNSLAELVKDREQLETGEPL